MNKDMSLHHQQQVEENMSNLTSASGDQASVSETSGSNFHYNVNPTMQQEQSFAGQSSQKKKRNQPGNPGKLFISSTQIFIQQKIQPFLIFL